MLHEYLNEILSGLYGHNINTVLYACNGTETEQSVQCMVRQSSLYHLTHTIVHPIADLPDIAIRIPTNNGHPIVMIQNSKHALKMFQNNLFLGAQLLVFGLHVTGYAHVREIAFLPDSTLYIQDAE